MSQRICVRPGDIVYRNKREADTPFATFNLLCGCTCLILDTSSGVRMKVEAAEPDSGCSVGEGIVANFLDADDFEIKHRA